MYTQSDQIFPGTTLERLAEISRTDHDAALKLCCAHREALTAAVLQGAHVKAASDLHACTQHVIRNSRQLIGHLDRLTSTLPHGHLRNAATHLRSLVNDMAAKIGSMAVPGPIISRWALAPELPILPIDGSRRSVIVDLGIEVQAAVGASGGDLPPTIRNQVETVKAHLASTHAQCEELTRALDALLSLKDVGPPSMTMASFQILVDIRMSRATAGVLGREFRELLGLTTHSTFVLLLLPQYDELLFSMLRTQGLKVESLEWLTSLSALGNGASATGPA